MFEIRVQGDIASSHQLPGYNGPCRNLHGHTWKIEVTVMGEKLDSLGLVVDFKELKIKLKKVLDPLDHQHLNDLDAFKRINPTTENIARHIYRAFAPLCQPLKLKEVRVWESETASVVYYE